MKSHDGETNLFFGCLWICYLTQIELQLYITVIFNTNIFCVFASFSTLIVTCIAVCLVYFIKGSPYVDWLYQRLSLCRLINFVKGSPCVEWLTLSNSRFMSIIKDSDLSLFAHMILFYGDGKVIVQNWFYNHGRWFACYFVVCGLYHNVFVKTPCVERELVVL